MTALRYLLWWLYNLFGLEARRLNLRIGRTPRQFLLNNGTRNMAKIGDKFTASIAPTNAAGASAPVTDVVFDELTAAYDFVSQSDDGLSAVFVAVQAGTGAVVTVTAKSKSGFLLADSKPLPDVEVPVDEEAVALNLTVA